MGGGADRRGLSGVWRSTRWRWPTTATATTSRAPNPMPPMPSCWPIWCAPTGTTTARLPATARRPRRSRSSPGDHQNLIWARTRHTNALRSALREYYPAALEAFEDLHDRDALAVLGRAPTPADAARLSLSKIRSALKHAGRQRNLDARSPGDRGRPAHRAARRPRRSHRRVRRDHPCRGGHHHRAEPPDRRARSQPGRAF